MDCSLLGSSVHGILQAEILEWVAFPSPGDLRNPGIKPGSLALQADSLLSEPPGTLRNVPTVDVLRLLNTLAVTKMAVIPGGREVTLNSWGKAIFTLEVTRDSLKNYLVALSYTRV